MTINNTDSRRAVKQSDPHFKLRLPVAVKAQMQIEAEQHRRSLSAEIVHILERHLQQNETAATAGKQTAAVSGH